MMKRKSSSTAPTLRHFGLATVLFVGICLLAVLWGTKHPIVTAIPTPVRPSIASPDATMPVVPRPTKTHSISPSVVQSVIIAPCRQQASEPFKPVTAQLYGIGRYPTKPFEMVKEGSIIKLPVPPDDDPGIFAWVASDRAADDTGMIRLTAHTWYDGNALGNVLIDKVTVGSVIILRGSQPTQVACYRFYDRQKVTVLKSATDAQRVRAASVLNRFNGIRPADDLGVMVCAGTRISAGNYPDRLNLFASRYSAKK